MSKIEVRDIWAEDLFSWFVDHITFSGGDGAGAIVVKNYKEVAQYFQAWYHEKFKQEIPHPWDEYERIVNFHDGNENFIFTDNPDVKLHRGDYIFIVREDCGFATTLVSDPNPRILHHV